MRSAFVFPGQGAQHIGMGMELIAASPAAADVFDRASEAIDTDLLRLCREGPAAELSKTENCQPLMLTVGVAAYAAARSWLGTPTWMAGLSLGEYSALVAAGSIDLVDAVRLVRRRGEIIAITTADRRVAMSAVIGVAIDQVVATCGSVAPIGVCEPALLNSARQVVVAGDQAAVDRFDDLIARGGGHVERLPVSSAFHTSILRPAIAAVDSLLATVDIGPPDVPVLGNALARPLDDANAIRADLLAQLTEPVRWSDTMAYLISHGVGEVVEFGAGRTLSGLARQASRTLTTRRVVDARSLAELRAPGRAGHMRAAGAAVRWKHCSTDRSILDQIVATAGRTPTDKSALIDPTMTITYGALAQRIARVSAELAAAGIRRGDRVVLQLPNGARFVLTLLALWDVGATAVMALPGYGARELEHVFRESGATAFVVPRRLQRRNQLEVVRAIAAASGRRVTVFVQGPGDSPIGGEPTGGPRVISLDRVLDDDEVPTPAPGRPTGRTAGPDDLALLLMSGGTTGPPKLIPRYHRDYRYNIDISNAATDVTPQTVYLAVLPVAHNFTLGCPGVLGVLASGGTVVFSRSPRPAEVLDAAHRFGAGLTALVPTLALQVAEEAVRRAGDRPRIRLVQVGGARLLPTAARTLRSALDCQVQQVYGMAEGLLNFTRPGDPPEVIEQTQGRPASPFDELLIVDPTGTPVPDGEVGELLTRGPYTISSYYAQDGAAAAFTPDGYFRTGDLVRWHPTGNLVVEGRIKDVINRAGEKVSAGELEECLLGHPALRDVAVVGAPDEQFGECVVVAGVARGDPSVTLAQIRRYLLDLGLARYKLPDRLFWCEALPVTGVGKVDKKALRAALAAAP